MGRQAPDSAEQGVAIFEGHADIAHDEVGQLARHGLDARVGSGGDGDLDAGAFEDHREHVADVGLVIDDEDAEAAERDRGGFFEGGILDAGLKGAIHRRRLRGVGGRELHRENGAIANAVARRGRDAAVELDEVTDDGETEAEAARRARGRTVALPEAIEDVG
jgi:hypothetical protein